MTDQHRHDGNIARQRGLQLDAHEVVRIVESALARSVARIDPPRPDDGEHRRAAADDVVQVSAKILPQRNRIHILEHARLAELGDEAVVDAAHGIRGCRCGDS